MTKFEMVEKLTEVYNMDRGLRAFYMSLPYAELQDAFEGYMALLGHAEGVFNV